MRAAEFAVIVYGALTLILTFCFGVYAGSAFAIELVVIAAALTYVYQFASLFHEPSGPTVLDLLIAIVGVLTVASIVASTNEVYHVL